MAVEKLDDVESLERADKRLRREVADPDFGKTEAQPSTTEPWRWGRGDVTGELGRPQSVLRPWKTMAKTIGKPWGNPGKTLGGP